MTEQSFKATWGGWLKGLTAGTITVLVGIAVIGWLNRDNGWIWITIMIVMPLTVLLVAALFTIRGYEVRRDELAVKRLLWNTRVNLEGLRSVDVDQEAMRGAWRLFGNGGLFSFSGWFRSGRLGTFRAYATHPKDAVVLKFDKAKVVVTPDDPKRFADLLSR